VLHCLYDHHEPLRNDHCRILDEFGPTIEYENIFEIIGRTMHPTALASCITGRVEHGSRSVQTNNVRHKTTEDSYPLDHQHHSQIKEKSIMKTTGSYIGFGSLFMRPGDLIVIFDGAKTPFLIRKEMNEQGIHTGRYTIVNDCYLHGWMYGDYFGHTVLEEDQDMPNYINDQSPEVPLYKDSGDLDRSGMDASPEAQRGKNSESSTKYTRKPILRKQTFVIC